MRGWSVTFVVSAILVAMVVATVALGGGGEESWHAAIRATARTSVALFLLAFTASALRRVMPWLLANRRYLGVSFAVSHALHLGAILVVASRWPRAPIVVVGNAPGMAAYAFILAMAVTSSDRAVAWLGARRWRVVHTVGLYVIWAAFFFTYLPHARADRAYWPIVALLAIALVLRFTPPLGRAPDRG
jgi:DMSO/TMAO reductase YedYZ heme-binding membrane subunit